MTQKVVPEKAGRAENCGPSRCDPIEFASLENAVVGLFEMNRKPLLDCGQLALLHRNVRNLVDSKAGPFIFEYFKTKMLPEGMKALKANLISRDDKGGGEAGTYGGGGGGGGGGDGDGDVDGEFLQTLCKVWQYFWEMLPTLESVLYRVKTKGKLSLRQTALVSFRDELLLKTDFEDVIKRMAVNKEQARTPSQLNHMVLILQGVIDNFPPNKSKLRLETAAAALISPYMGYKGLFLDLDFSQPAVPSTEPAIHATRRASEFGRRFTRLASIPPQQMETLNELFRKAVRKQANPHSPK